MYDPTIGRWLSEDPVGFDAGDANLYRYVENDSTDATDPSGLQGPAPPARRTRIQDYQDQEIEAWANKGQPHPGRIPYSARIHFDSAVNNSTDRSRRRTVLYAIAEASSRIDSALYALRNYWPGIQQMYGRDPEMAFLFFGNNSQVYMARLESAYAAITSPATIEFSINTSQSGTNLAYVLSFAGYSVGSTIYINPFFFISQGGRQTSAFTRWTTVAREFGRRFPRIANPTTIRNWDLLIVRLSDNFVELRQRSQPRLGPQ